MVRRLFVGVAIIVVAVFAGVGVRSAPWISCRLNSAETDDTERWVGVDRQLVERLAVDAQWIYRGRLLMTHGDGTFYGYCDEYRQLDKAQIRVSVYNFRGHRMAHAMLESRTRGAVRVWEWEVVNGDRRHCESDEVLTRVVAEIGASGKRTSALVVIANEDSEWGSTLTTIEGPTLAHVLAAEMARDRGEL